MKTETVRLYSLNYNQARTYSTAIIFAAGNILLPQMFHLIPQGGITWLPIYFFTLIAAYKYGWKTGLLTAILSPLVNWAIFDMPSSGVLLSVSIKSILLAVAAGWAAKHYNRVSILLLTAVVIFYQITGSLISWAIEGNLSEVLNDLRIGIPGMLLQIFGGYGFIKYLLKR